MKQAYKDAVKKDSIDWSNIVMIIPAYNNNNVNEIVQAMCETWMRHIGAKADVVLVTDEDDTRASEEILPSPQDMEHMQATMHVRKSPAMKEGSKTRYKVIDGFNYALSDLFKDTEGEEIFLKIDTDSFVVPENLMDVIDKMRKETYPLPVEFGRGVCITDNTCYSQGGKMI